MLKHNVSINLLGYWFSIPLGISQLHNACVQDCSPFNIVIVLQVMPLAVLLKVVKNDNRSDKVDYFPCRQKNDIVSTILSTVAISSEAQKS